MRTLGTILTSRRRSVHNTRTGTVVAMLLILLSAADPTSAESILDQALAKAAQATPALAGLGSASVGVQQIGCAPELVTRARDDASRVGTGGYLAGGLFLPVIMPLIADGSASSPPFVATNGMNPDDARCYSAAYSEDLQQRKVSSAWKGTWIGIGTYVGLVVLVAATAPDYRY